MTININNGITVDIRLIPKKNKTNNDLYCIYIGFYIYQNGIKQDYHSISTGINCMVTEFKNDKVTGKSDKANLINGRLYEYLTSAKDMLTQLTVKKIKTCGELLNEIRSNAKEMILGKAPRGKKNDFISKLKDYQYSEILNRYLDKKQPSKDRKRNYLFTVKLLNEYFNNEIPIINQITSSDLQDLKKWMSEKYKNQNTATTFLAQIAAIFKYAVTELKILAVNPIPENFRGSFVDGNRQVLDENECLKIMNLDEDKLSQTKKTAKYCLMVQMLTGIGYGDMQNMKHENIKYHGQFEQYYIEKNRNKTTELFVVNLTKNALYYINKLKDLIGDDKQPFNLPSIEYMIRIYKELAKDAGVTTNIATYTLRHTFSVNYMENDGRLEDLQIRLGHKDLKTTQIYGKISAKRLAQTTTDLESKSKIHQLQTIKLKAV